GRMAKLVGRDEELAAVDRFFERPLPSALVIEGEAGVGKTTVWHQAVQVAEGRGWRVLSATPGETEVQLPYAALGDVLGSTIKALDELPSPQRHALGVALLLEEP